MHSFIHGALLLGRTGETEAQVLPVKVSSKASEWGRCLQQHVLECGLSPGEDT